MNLYKLICFLTFLPFCLSTKVSECAIDVPLPRFVQINDCVIQPCVLKTGTAVTANVTFDIFEDVSVLTPQVYVSLSGAFISFPLPDNKGCNHLLGNRCPLESGERITFQLYMPLDKNLPQIELNLRLVLVSEKSKLSCFEVGLSVQK